MAEITETWPLKRLARRDFRLEQVAPLLSWDDLEDGDLSLALRRRGHTDERDRNTQNCRYCH